MSYIEDNRWLFTSSKLKVFKSNPEEYYLRYETEVVPEKKTTALSFWTLVDDYISFSSQVFNDKYIVLDKGKRKSSWWIKDWFIQINDTEWTSVKRIERELKRQPLIDYDWVYDKQKEIIIEWNGVKIKWTLDRFSKEKKMIRDWKTTSQPDKFKYDLATGYNYILQQAFYWWIIKESEWIECTCLIDMIGSTYPHCSNVIEIPKYTILKEIEEVIKPAVLTYKVCKEQDHFPFTWNRSDYFTSSAYPYLKGVIQAEYDSII